MSERKRDKPKSYFDRLWQIPESAIDYETAPKTKASDWKEAEELIPMPVATQKKRKRPAAAGVAAKSSVRGKRSAPKDRSQRQPRRTA